MKTLLVADDEPANIALIRMIVEDSGLEVRLVTAATGDEALAHARALVPDLILMDLKMRVLDGWEATRRLKADDRTKAIPVVAVTGHALAGHSEGAKRAGCDSFVTKPCLPDQLLAEVKRMLELNKKGQRARSGS